MKSLYILIEPLYEMYSCYVLDRFSYSYDFEIRSSRPSGFTDKSMDLFVLLKK